ncbi:MAG: hypothetical protein ACYDDF_12780 [Thermoplasmatota archaeon]
MTKALTTQEWQARVRRVRDRYAKRRTRVWPEGTIRTCPLCGKRSLRGVSDLSREEESNGVMVVFANLHGARCQSCGTEFLEAYEQIALEDKAQAAFRGAVSGSVTALGGHKLGTYWPRDIARALDLHAKDQLLITPLSEDTAVVRVVHEGSDERERDVAFQEILQQAQASERRLKGRKPPKNRFELK